MVFPSLTRYVFEGFPMFQFTRVALFAKNEKVGYICNSLICWLFIYFWWETLLYLDCSTFVMPRNALSTLPPIASLRACDKGGLMACLSLLRYSAQGIFIFKTSKSAKAMLISASMAHGVPHPIPAWLPKTFLIPGLKVCDFKLICPTTSKKEKIPETPIIPGNTHT